MKRVYEVVLLVVLSIIIIYISSTIKPKTKEQLKQKTEIVEPQHDIQYGIITDSLSVFKDKVLPNQNLSEILLPYNVSYQTIDLIVKRSDMVFDVRKIRAGNSYAVICDRDSSEHVKYFVYEKSATSYVVFEFGDSIFVHVEKRDVIRKTKITSGTITSSLWNAMVENNTNPFLAIELSEVYAWAIDFFGLQKGDKFKVIYEELFVEDKPVGLGKVSTAVFTHAGKDFWAFYFFQDSIGDYFDEEANSLRRSFLKAPLRFSRISSRFSHSRLHPVLKIRRPHHGVDYAAPRGTPVLAIGDGIVIKHGRSGGAGNMIKIKHNGTYSTAYLHLSKYAKGLKSGQFVSQGDVIGFVGSTGLSTGPHLDFRFYKNGHAVDPLKVESPPVEPVDPTNIKEFNKTVKIMSRKLKRIRA